jgi:uncharacterized protein YlaN (UPF0358 family)
MIKRLSDEKILEMFQGNFGNTLLTEEDLVFYQALLDAQIAEFQKEIDKAVEAARKEERKELENWFVQEIERHKGQPLGGYLWKSLNHLIAHKSWSLGQALKQEEK